MSDAWVCIRTWQQAFGRGSAAKKKKESARQPGDVIDWFWKEGNWVVPHYPLLARTRFYFYLLTNIPDTATFGETEYRVREHIKDVFFTPYEGYDGQGNLEVYFYQRYAIGGGGNYNPNAMLARIGAKSDTAHVAQFCKDGVEQPLNSYIEIDFDQIDDVFYDRADERDMTRDDFMALVQSRVTDEDIVVPEPPPSTGGLPGGS